MKSYTDIKQSRKLAEFLPIDSADGFWEYHDKWYSEGDEWEGYEDYPRAEPYLECTRMENEWKEDKSDVPCWSLAALLSVIPCSYRVYRHPYDDGLSLSLEISNCMEVAADNEVDACVEMIMKLHENNVVRLWEEK
jgi:hypothetical protein